MENLTLVNSSPHAVCGVNCIDSVQYTMQNISYTSFKMADTLSQVDSSLVFNYGPDYGRKKTISTIDSVETTKYYSGAYEKIITPTGTRELHYIGAYGRIIALYEITDTAQTEMYYVHTDHLGSINCITNANDSIVQETSFSAWGKRRNPSTWEPLDNAPSNLITTCGYTGHEHIDEFNLINMNGRIYDPVLCRFISPDPFIANQSNSQDYNRYSYVLNNPLSYTDPTGYQKYSCEITNGMFWNDISRRGGGGSLFPKWGGLHGAHSRLEYDLMLAGNFDRAGGDGTFHTNGVLDHLTAKDGKSDGYYSVSDINRCLRDGILKQKIFEQTTDHWTAVEDENGTIIFNGRKVRLTHYMGSTTERRSEWEVALGGGGMGFPEIQNLEYSIEGISIWAGTVQTGFDAARKLQPATSTLIKGAKVLGKTSNLLGVTSIGYDFATGSANSSTVADGLVMIGGGAAVFFGGVALAPWVAGAGVLYGIVSISGGEAWLNRNFDISGYINIVKSPKP